jgi:hypothetical protein
MNGYAAAFAIWVQFWRKWQDNQSDHDWELCSYCRQDWIRMNGEPPWQS